MSGLGEVPDVASRLIGSALVVLDCEEGVAASTLEEELRPQFVSRMASIIDSSAAAGIPVVQVAVELRTGYPDVSASNDYFASVREAGRLLAHSSQTEMMPELELHLQDAPRVSKRRIGALTDTDLALILRSLNCDGIVVAGLISRGAVLSTVTVGADLDYRMTVIEDCCHDPDPEVHAVLMEDVIPLRAKVISSEEFRAGARSLKEGRRH